MMMMMMIIIIIVVVVVVVVVVISSSIITIHFPYLTAIYLIFKRVDVSLTKHFLFTFLPKTF